MGSRTSIEIQTKYQEIVISLLLLQWFKYHELIKYHHFGKVK